MEEADERFEEGLALIIKSWTSNERFSHHGKYWNFENIIVEPPTAQKPHPPIWMAAGSPDSIRKVARRGAKLLLDQLASIALDDRALQHLQGRGRGLRPALRSDGCRASAARSIVAKNAEDKAKADRGAARQPDAAGEARATPDGNEQVEHAVVRPDARRRRPRARCSARPTRSPRSFAALRAAGIEHVLLNGPTGSRENLRAFARDVMPAFAGPAAERRADAAGSRSSRTTVVHKPVPRAFGGIPPLIKRNTVLFALSQSFVGAGTQLAYGIGPLMVIAVTGSASLAGLTVGLFGISRFLVSYPVGKITDITAASPASCSGRAWR